MRALVSLCVVVAVGGADVVAAPLAPERLTPADLALPTPRLVEQGGAHRTSACSDAPTPETMARLPFQAGERLQFSVSLLGVHAGEIGLQVEPPVNVDGVNVLPARGRVKTDGVVATVGSFDVSMVVFLDPQTARPTRMANRSVFRAIFDTGPTTTREDAAFAANVMAPTGPDGGQVSNRLDVFTDGKTTLTNTQLKTSSDVVDTLSILYWLRSRELVAGQRFCFEMFHRKKLWQVEAVVGEVASTTSATMTRPARRLEVRILRAKKGVEARPMTVWISDDADRLPMLLTTPEYVEVVLSGWQRGRGTTSLVTP